MVEPWENFRVNRKWYEMSGSTDICYEIELDGNNRKYGDIVEKEFFLDEKVAVLIEDDEYLKAVGMK